ncbi:MAG: hypothetical protein IKH30_19990 [Clostridia bacterium]|nr:hypothetical protein [Clostridia bacterium]
MKRLVALLLVIACVCATSTALCYRDAPIGYYLRFVPTMITVGSSYVKVTGYFVNLNDDVEILNITKLKMNIYQNNKKILQGDFGTISQFSIPPLDMYKITLTFKGKNSLKVGTYACDENYSSKFSCSFSYYEY